MMSMPPLVGALWREVARHEDIEGSTVALARLLRSAAPFEWLLVRRWDAERARLETVARAGVPVEHEARTPMPTPRRDVFLAWAARGTAEGWANREFTSVARMCVPEGVGGAVVAGPLRVEGRVVGVLLVGTGSAAAVGAVRDALEPFAVAIENDTRLHELARLREAAEQDRSALLARLARQDVSDAIIGAERGLREVMARVAQVAPTDAPVLILGETGAGKEVVARAIHGQSRRHGGPFLRVNCGAIPTELVDSELFGHEKGSFTGAIAQRKGWFERADGGTLFLDEVAELPSAAQVRLLRVLQDGSFERVGGQQTHTADVRIVAATHRDMARMVRDGGFRQDLWYRISVFPLLLPALRERPGDIPALALHFAQRAGVRLFGRPLAPSAEDVLRLTAYDWPGNVRELASVIERAAILGGGHGLQIVPALGLAPTVGVRTVEAPSSRDRASIETALTSTHGRIEGPFGAAAILGINPHTLRSRMRRLGIEWGQFRGRG
ncbi:MAG: sigma-54 dependent transcriptional regulator [Pseudomonadota bacterium]|nr:sigma-54 dependent transcriptional regulator [Pseudomonadota bacterium]